MEPVADQYRRLATTFTDRVASVPHDAWQNRTPCEEWTARELVGHVMEVHGRFEALVGRDLADHPSVDDDPVAAWVAVREQMQADLDDPERAATEYDGRFGRSTFADSVGGFVCFDLVVHGWDLARATGLDDTIEPRDVERIQAMVDRMGETMRANGVIKQPLEPAPDASAQNRLLCALGRDPRAGQPRS